MNTGGVYEYIFVPVDLLKIYVYDSGWNLVVGNSIKVKEGHMVTDSVYAARQIAALKYLIFNAKQVDVLSKQILGFLIDKSEGLTKEVCITLTEDKEGYSAREIDEAMSGISNMESCNGWTHIDQIMILFGSDFRFSLHYGDFDPNRVGNEFDNSGQFSNMGLDRSQVTSDKVLVRGMPLRYTFWLAKERYSRKANFIIITRKELSSINIETPGLYPEIEAQHMKFANT